MQGRLDHRRVEGRIGLQVPPPRLPGATGTGRQKFGQIVIGKVVGAIDDHAPFGCDRPTHGRCIATDTQAAFRWLPFHAIGIDLGGGNECVESRGEPFVVQAMQVGVGQAKERCREAGQHQSQGGEGKSGQAHGEAHSAPLASPQR